jgi:hypothetical protein
MMVQVTFAGIRRSGMLAALGMLSPNLRQLLDLGVIKRVPDATATTLAKAGGAATATAGRVGFEIANS